MINIKYYLVLFYWKLILRILSTIENKGIFTIIEFIICADVFTFFMLGILQRKYFNI